MGEENTAPCHYLRGVVEK